MQETFYSGIHSVRVLAGEALQDTRPTSRTESSRAHCCQAIHERMRDAPAGIGGELCAVNSVTCIDLPDP